MFYSLPIVFIYYRIKGNELVNVLPLYIFNIFSDAFKIKVLNNDYYFNLIKNTISIESQNIYNGFTSTGDLDETLHFLTDKKHQLNEKKQLEIDKLLP